MADLEDSYEKLKQRKIAAGFEQRHGSQVVAKDRMRLVCVGLELDVQNLDSFAREYAQGLVEAREAAVNYSGMMVVPPDFMVGVIVDMILLGAYHHEQARREIEGEAGE